MKLINLSKKDKEIFYNEVQKLTPMELIQAMKELEIVKDSFSKASWKYICSIIGKKSYKLLKNVAKYKSFEKES